LFDALRRLRRKRILRTAALPDSLWRAACDALPFLAIYTDDERTRLRDLVVLFLDAKSIVGAQGHAVTPLQRTIIAIQACVLVLYLDMAYYDGWENVIVYPDEFIIAREFEDEAGVVHRHREQLAGESMPGGPVVLSWSDVEAGADWDAAGMNLVIHEFAHKLDMRNGEANGCPPLPTDIRPRHWQEAMTAAYEHFRARVESGKDTAIDPYAAESPAEFFAVASEVFFVEPALLLHEYAKVYDLLRRFYGQDPARRAELLMEWEDHVLPAGSPRASALTKR
jgi:Mlc titration factor MtfA (ptsG expression regulator)